LPGFVENAVGDTELAHVVQQPRAAEQPALGGVEPHRGGDALGDLGHPGRVTRGEGRLGVGDPREGLGDAVQACVVGPLHAVGRFYRVDVGPAQRAPEAHVVLEGGDGVDQRRVEPGPTTGAGHLARSLWTTLLPEDLHRLREAHHARQR
jgi:hypothetical protein